MRYLARISSDGRSREQVRWLVALVTAGFFAFFTVGLWPARSQTGGLVLIALFNLIPLALVVLAVHSTLRNRRWGRLELELDPSPGSVGGHVGGSVDVPILPCDGQAFRVSLACLDTHRDADDEVRVRAVWQRSQAPEIDESPDRVRLRFAFEVPASLPPSNSEERAIRWQLRVVGDVPGVDLDARFQLPVERIDPPRYSNVVERAATEAQALPDLAQALPPDIVIADVAGEELGLHYVPGRTRQLSRLLLVAAVLLFGASAWLLWRFDWDAASVYMPFPFFSVFLGAFGGVFLWGWWVYADNALDVRLKPDWLTVERNRFGKTSRKTVHRRQIESIGLEALSLSEGSESRWAVYRLGADLVSGGKLTVADGIPGSATLDRVAKVYEEWLGEPIRYD